MVVIDKRKLYGNENNAFILCEYRRELQLIKKLINISERAISEQPVENTWSYEGVCHSFAKTILDYSKMAFDNVILGHFHAANMINRSVLENLVCLKVIMDYKDLELWKYYWVHSYYNTIHKFDKTPRQDQLDMLEYMYKDLNISEDFYRRCDVGKNDRKTLSYIERPYGWIYKISGKRRFSFAGLCDLIEDNAEYDGFGLMSEYSHGTSFYTKLQSSISVHNVMFILVNLYKSLELAVSQYCCDEIDEDFCCVANELQFIFDRFVEYEEEHFEYL